MKKITRKLVIFTRFFGGFWPVWGLYDRQFTGGSLLLFGEGE